MIVMMIVSILVYLFCKGYVSFKVLLRLSFVIGLGAIVFWMAWFFQSQSLSLADESLGDVKIDQTFEKGSSFVEHPQFSNLNETIYMKKGNNGYVVTVNQHHRVTSIFNQSKQTGLQTSKGISIGDNYQTVIQTYGDQYKKLWFVEGYSKGIQYQDQLNGIILDFFFNDEAVALIELRNK